VALAQRYNTRPVISGSRVRVRFLGFQHRPHALRQNHRRLLLPTENVNFRRQQSLTRRRLIFRRVTSVTRLFVENHFADRRFVATLLTQRRDQFGVGQMSVGQMIFGEKTWNHLV